MVPGFGLSRKFGLSLAPAASEKPDLSIGEKLAFITRSLDEVTVQKKYSLDEVTVQKKYRDWCFLMLKFN